MDKRERVRSALAGRDVDRVPVGFWGHDYVREWSPQGLADHHLELYRRYDMDYVKVNPRATYYMEAWGSRFRPSGDPTKGPEVIQHALTSASDLAKVGPLDPQRGPFGEQLEALALIRDGLAGEAPFVQTVFSPLAVIGRMVEGGPRTVRAWMSDAPDALASALDAVTETLGGYARACLDAGADGIFYPTVDWGTYDNISEAEFDTFSRPYDFRVLAAASDGWFNILHVCRRNNMLRRLLDYPVHAFNWAATLEGNPTLGEAQTLTDRAIMGGLSEQTALRTGTPSDVVAEVREALRETGGRRFLLAPGCSISPQTPHSNLMAAVEAARAAGPVS